MGIFNTGRSIDNIYNSNRSIKAIYNNGRLIWSIDSQDMNKNSCFFNGYWLDEYPWTDELPWTD